MCLRVLERTPAGCSERVFVVIDTLELEFSSHRHAKSFSQLPFPLRSVPTNLHQSQSVHLSGAIMNNGFHLDLTLPSCLKSGMISTPQHSAFTLELVAHFSTIAFTGLVFADDLFKYLGSVGDVIFHGTTGRLGLNPSTLKATRANLSIT